MKISRTNVASVGSALPEMINENSTFAATALVFDSSDVQI